MQSRSEWSNIIIPGPLGVAYTQKEASLRGPEESIRMILEKNQKKS